MSKRTVIEDDLVGNTLDAILAGEDADFMDAGCAELDRLIDEADYCATCGKPIDHGDPHMTCDVCRS